MIDLGKNYFIIENKKDFLAHYEKTRIGFKYFNGHCFYGFDENSDFPIAIEFHSQTFLYEGEYWKVTEREKIEEINNILKNKENFKKLIIS